MYLPSQSMSYLSILIEIGIALKLDSLFLVNAINVVLEM